MIMKTVQNGVDQIDHVEYGNNVVYFYSSRNRQGRTKTEMISRRITSRIMKNYTDDEYNTLLETVIKTARNAVSDTPSNKKKKRSCRSCHHNGTCKGVRSCTESMA